MKILKWFKTGEPIPMDAAYIKTETLQTNEWDDDERRGVVVTCEDFHLYEVHENDPEPAL